MNIFLKGINRSKPNPEQSDLERSRKSRKRTETELNECLATVVAYFIDNDANRTSSRYTMTCFNGVCT